MSEPLATYLHDHLAGSTFAVDLLESLIREHQGEPLGNFASILLVEIQDDQEVLRRLSERVGTAHLEIKDAAAWLAEKLSRFKLSRAAQGELATFEALETLALGIHGKLALWNGLASIADLDERLSADYPRLIQRATEQHAKVEWQRLQSARGALLEAAVQRS